MCVCAIGPLDANVQSFFVGLLHAQVSAYPYESQATHSLEEGKALLPLLIFLAAVKQSIPSDGVRLHAEGSRYAKQLHRVGPVSLDTCLSAQGGHVPFQIS